MAYQKIGSAFVYEDGTDNIVGARDEDGQVFYFPRFLSPARANEAVSPISRNGAETLAQFLDHGESVTLALMGDSTGNATTEWLYTFAEKLAADYPNAQVEHLLWDDGAQAYGSATVIQAGTIPRVLAFRDDCSGTSADVIGRTPVDTGSAWAGDTNAAGDWSVTGGNLVRSSDATVSFARFGGGVTGDQTVTLTGMNFSTIGDGAATRLFTVAFNYLNASNYLNFQIRVTSAGAVTIYFFKMIGGVQTLVSSAASPAAIPGSTASVTGDLVITRDGLDLTATFGATTLTGTILQADADAVAASTEAALGGGLGNLVGMTISAVQLEVEPTGETVQTIRFYNGSMPGQSLSYQGDRLDDMLPVTPDILLISSVHNYTTTSGATYYGIVAGFCDSLLSRCPDAAIILSSQNPEKPPAPNFAYHAERNRHLRKLAQDRGYGYIAAFETFLGTTNWQSLVDADGFHTTSAGSLKWRDAAAAAVDEFVAVTP